MKTRKAIVLLLVIFAVLVFVVPVNAEDNPEPDAGGKVTASDSATVKVEGEKKIEDSATTGAEKEEKSEKKEPTENLKPLKSVKIESVDIVNFELMKKSKKFDKDLAIKVQNYIAKLDRNVYAKIDEIRKLMLEDSWNLESVEIPIKEKKEEKVKPISKKDDADNVKPVKPKYIKDTYHKEKIEHKDSDIKDDLNQINDYKYIDVGIDVEKCTEPEKKKKIEIVSIDSGIRMTTATSVAVNRQMVILQTLIIEYHAALLEYLKFKYIQLLDSIDFDVRTLPVELENEANDGGLTTKSVKIKKTKYINKFEEAWKIDDWEEDSIELKLVDALTDVWDNAKSFSQRHLLQECDMKFVMSLEKIIGINDELKKKTVKATFRAGWSEFDLGWLMFIFGILTLYGGLTWTFIIDFRSRRKSKK